MLTWGTVRITRCNRRLPIVFGRGGSQVLSVVPIIVRTAIGKIWSSNNIAAMPNSDTRFRMRGMFGPM